MARYPAECPVFEVTSFSDGRVIAVGEHVEGMGPVSFGYNDLGRTATFQTASPIAVRHPDHSIGGRSRNPREGWIGAAMHPKQLRPLTRAAREMLALALVTP